VEPQYRISIDGYRVRLDGGRCVGRFPRKLYTVESWRSRDSGWSH